mmetsp:Transcript_7725/g.8974  ORF Transcript_7725/g.8974 Transcript_7725/m.8974 type:complete len:525 (+) Transcript_7725:75-1649(+)
MSDSSVQFIVGNTYEEIPESKAKLDRSGNFKKIHDWILYVDIVAGDPETIERVSFDLGGSFSQVFHCSYPIPQTPRNQKRSRSNNGRAAARQRQQHWRFKTRQQSYGSVTAAITIRGSGGSVLKTSHRIILSADTTTTGKSPLLEFRETNVRRPLQTLKLPEKQRFGIELELTSAMQVNIQNVGSNLGPIGGKEVKVIGDYGKSRQTSEHWKLVPDSSIMCSISQPDCNKFELVSPILQGGRGLSEMNLILRRLEGIRPKPKVNKSMGFHCHVDVSSLSIVQLIKICQNFIKYEDLIDTFMPKSRRNGSPESERYFHSNRTSVAESLHYSEGGATDSECHEALERCGSTEELVSLMNSNGRYHKLNLTNLSNGRQPTIEFRQHSSTMSFAKVGSWVRFCVAFCVNSARLASPSPFKDDRDPEKDKLEALFQYVIKDRALRNFYWERRKSLEEENEEACCSGCSSGSVCNSHNECSICYEPNSVGVTVLGECGHRFHRECISRWLNDKESCPICRKRWKSLRFYL